MNNTRQFLSRLSKFSLEWETFQTKDVEEIQIHILGSIYFF